MKTSEEIHRLEAELDFHKEDLRADAAQVNNKIEQTKERLSPTKFLRERAGLSYATATALLLGAGLRLALSRKLPERMAKAALDNIGRPASRALLNSIATHRVTRAIRSFVRKRIG